MLEPSWVVTAMSSIGSSIRSAIAGRRLPCGNSASSANERDVAPVWSSVSSVAHRSASIKAAAMAPSGSSNS